MPNILTCVYCGQAYPEGTPAHGPANKVLTDHIKVCPKHPLKKALDDIKLLRGALVGVVGVDSKDALEEMLSTITAGSSVSRKDVYCMLEAVRALLATMPEGPDSK